MTALQKYEERVDEVNSLVCVGLDSDVAKIPESFKNSEFPQFEFNKYIVEQTHEFAAAYKLDTAFYENRGEQGIREMRLTMNYLTGAHPGILTICDAKRGDVAHVNEQYVKAYFDSLGFDAITLHPYMGKESLEPFLARKEKASIILCRTSNPGAKEFQDLNRGGKPLWQDVAEKVSNEWNTNGNCMLVVGATYPEAMKQVRDIVGDMTILAPGIGFQEGDLGATVQAGLNSQGKGLIIHSSRAIIFSADPKTETLKLREKINAWR